MQEIALDRTDREILNLLQNDATLSAAAIGEQIGLSQSPCWRRIQRLRDSGLIRAEVALLDRRKAGFQTEIFALVKLSAHGRSNLSEFSAAIEGFPEVTECHLLLGTVDFLLRIVTEDMDAYEQFFFHKLSQLPGVQEITSSIALSQVKQTTALPL